ncbi:MAG: TatD family hydrolase [Lentisphaeria bacterium]|nr:TatD family hydrolase [Lentisphaeria bacterium]
MNIIEPHIHMYSRTTDDYQRMYAAGIRACVEPSFWMGENRRYAGSFWDYWNLILNFETTRAIRYGIDHWAAIGFNPKEAENRKLTDETLAGMGEYLDHPRCVAVGEIGLNNNTENEMHALRQQLIMAEERKMPVMLHLPHFNKVQGAQMVVDLIRAEGLTEERIEIDHNTEETFPITRETNCYTGMTIYPYSKLDPVRASRIIKDFGTDKMLINGSADWGVSDPLSIIKVAEFMRQDGHDEETIQKLLHDNSNDFFSVSPNWKPNFDITPIPVSDYQRQP